MKEITKIIKKWDNNEGVWSVERGGIGPGYEQAIQVGVFELCRDMKDTAIPEAHEPLNKLFDKRLIRVINKNEKLKGLSGAQAGMIKDLAYRFLKNGYQNTLDDAKKHGLNLIIVDKNI